MKNTKKAAPKKSTKKVSNKVEKTNLLIAKYHAFLLDIYTVSKKEEIVFSSFIKKHKVSNSISKVLVDNYFVLNGRWASMKPNKSLTSRIIELIREYNKEARKNEPIVATTEQVSDIINLQVSDTIEKYKERIAELEALVEVNKSVYVNTERKYNDLMASFQVSETNLNNIKTGYNSLNKDLIDLVSVHAKAEFKIKTYDTLVTDIVSRWWYKALTLIDKKIYVRISERFKLKS